MLDLFSFQNYQGSFLNPGPSRRCHTTGFLNAVFCKNAFRLLTSRAEMLSKVRQFREKSSRLNGELRQLNETLPGSAKRSYDVEDQSGQSSRDEMYRQQVLHGAAVLEKTSQSIERSVTCFWLTLFLRAIYSLSNVRASLNIFNADMAQFHLWSIVMGRFLFRICPRPQLPPT